MRVKYIFLLWAVIFMIGNAFAQDFNPSVVKVIQFDNAIAQIDDTYNGYMGAGTGYLVSSDGVIVTTKSNVEKAVLGYILYKDNNSKSVLKTYKTGIEQNQDVDCIVYGSYANVIIQVYSDANNYTLYKAKVLNYSDEHECAIIKIDTDLYDTKVTTNFKTTNLGNSNLVKSNDQLKVYGYNIQNKANFDAILATKLSVVNVKNQGLNTSVNSNFGVFSSSVVLNKGFNGGVVTDANNSIVGISFNKNSKTYISTINSIYYLVKPDPKLFATFSKKGIVKPNKGQVIAASKGSKRLMPDFSYCRNKNVTVDLENITGLIKSADSGKAIKNASIGLLDYDARVGDYVMVCNGTTNKNGTFKLEPGIELNKKYSLTIMAAGYENLLDIIEITSSNKNLTITLAKER